MRIIEYIKLVRPFNFLFVILAVLFGAYYRTELILDFVPIVAAFSAAFICSSGYIWNDIYDIEIDRINKPHRPLPAGNISLPSAKKFGIILFVLGFIMVIFLQNLPMIILALFNSVILWIYARKGKQLLLVSNIIVAFATASTFLYGGISNNNFGNSLFIFSAAFIYTLIRELIKDMEDVRGDKKNVARTVPLVYGSKKTLTFSLMLAILFNTVLLAGFLNGYYELIYYYIILVFVGLFVIFDLIFLYYKRKNVFVYFSEQAMKINMLVFLIILWVVQ
ncbi:MAG: geranylgeranylglycerol-phosphate geranylgeranyltransferase [Candidatus Cloacimonetes bacterium]|nr:geranylgeranylglycerol-phosphate geranylgeranyltransferase [Candidatus Cloacimonadota bacterium]MBS3767169.1 geranylgeranylglycerol-phosphate geranylgeranyltransferase [Candidatus Cloacimonadota bacterium]